MIAINILVSVFMLVLGNSAYGQEIATYDGNQYEIEKIAEGRFLSHISYERKLDGAGWTNFVIMHPRLGIIPTNEVNAKRLPVGTQILVPVTDVKTKWVRVENQSLEQVCQKDTLKDPNCLRIEAKINPQVKDTGTPITGELLVLQGVDLTPAPAESEQQKPSSLAAIVDNDDKDQDQFADLRAQNRRIFPLGQFGSTIFLAGLFCAAMVAACFWFDAIKRLRHRRLRSADFEKKLELIRQYLIQTIEKTGVSWDPNLLRAHMTGGAPKILYEARQTDNEVYGAFVEAVTIYDEAGGRPYLEKRPDGSGSSYPVHGIQFDKINGVSLKCLREIGEKWLSSPKLVKFGDRTREKIPARSHSIRN